MSVLFINKMLVNIKSFSVEFSAFLKVLNFFFQKLYKKQLRDVIDTYHGYQTMDSRVHPDVLRGQKAHNLISDVSNY